MKTGILSALSTACIHSLFVLALPVCVMAQDNEIDIEDFFANGDAPKSEQETAIEDSTLTVEDSEIIQQTETPRFFEVPQNANPALEFVVQQQLLDQSNNLAKLLREIKEQGNEEAVLALLASFSDSPNTVAFFEEAFTKIEANNSVESADSVKIDIAEVRGVPAPAAPIRRVTHQILPVFAQVDSNVGGRDKAIVAINGQRYIRLPGETIEHEGRSILLESIEQSTVNGREIYTIWVIEKGSRSSLVWN